MSARYSVLSVLTFTFFGCVAWGLYLQSEPTSDWLYFYQISKQFLEGDSLKWFKTKSITTTAYGMLFQWLLGSGWLTNYIASALALVVGSAFVYAAILPFTGNRRQARFVCFALALCPTFLVFIPNLGSKIIFYLVSAICAWLISLHLHGREYHRWLYLGLGLALGLLFQTRPHGALLLPVCVGIVAMTGAAPARQARSSAPPPGMRPTTPKRWTPCLLMLVAFASVLLAHGSLYYIHGQGFQLMSHQLSALNLLHGTNVDSKGMHDPSQVALIEMDKDKSYRKTRAFSTARKVALERITSDVPGFFKFAFTTKMKSLYGRDTMLFRGAYGGSDRGDVLDRHVKPTAEHVEMGVYRLVFLLFLALLAREIWRPGRLLVLGVIVLLYSLPHLFYEVHYRFHQLMLPYFVVGAALLAYELTQKGKLLARRRKNNPL